MKSVIRSFLVVLLSAAPIGVYGQTPSGTPVQTQRPGDNPLYRVTINVVERDIKAVNYQVRGRPTRVDFKGTTLMPDADGKAWVEGKKGYTEVKADFDDLKPPSTFGPEYLTYVLWAITPQGRATNLGEIILDGDNGELNVTTELQAFGLIVTAEPYFAVSQPSDVVVLENFIRDDTKGTVEEIDAKYELLQRGQYVVNVNPADLKPQSVDSKTPLDLAEARNAVQIAMFAGAPSSSPDTFQKAQSLLAEAEALHSKDKSKKKISTVARQAVQVAEDARLVTVKRQEEARLAAERQAASDRESAARAQAEEQARLKREADAARAQADAEQRLELERRSRAEAEERAAREQAEAARADAERARLEAQSQTEEARRAVERAESEKAQLRADLKKQFESILETRDTARGLIVNISDVLFDTGQYSLKPGAREKLAKVAGILLAHPGLMLEIDGHTDNVGSEEFNQELSEHRAMAVRDYLVSQGLPSGSITVRGLGESEPVASNDTPAGRQQNRRVELVVNGDEIETRTSTTISGSQ